MSVAAGVENLKALTSLRFVAAFMIIIHHAPASLRWEWPKHFPGTTFHGVSFFFVLSGFNPGARLQQQGNAALRVIHPRTLRPALARPRVCDILAREKLVEGFHARQRIDAQTT